MTLGTFFRDYVYIPMGGNRSHVVRNLLVVWFLTGLWHGASWNFVLWGLFYGVVLILEKLFLLKPLEKAPAWIAHLYTGIIVLIAWVLFAFTDLSAAGAYLKIMFGGAAFANGLSLYYLRDNALLLVVCAIASTPYVSAYFNRLKGTKWELVYPLLTAAGLFACTAFIVDASYNPFLYFRF